MLTRIDVDSENPFFLPVLGVTPKDSLLIKKITGLNPPDITLFIGDFSSDGGIYQGRRVGNRNVVVTLDLNPNPALGENVAGLREMLYKAFVDPQVEGDHIKLRLTDDEGRVRYLYGYVEKFETEIFDVETMVQISIICPDPYIRDNVETVSTDASGWTSRVFTYSGTAEVGFEVWSYINSNTTTFVLANNTVTNTTTDANYIKGRMILTGRTFSSGDVVYVNTVRGQRTIETALAADVSADIASYPSDTWRVRWPRLKAADKTIPIVAYLSATSPWIELHSSTNTAVVHGTLPANQPAVMREIRFTQSYWGI